MATIARSPIYVPNPEREPIWNWKPPGSWPLRNLTQQKIYGVGGQAPTKRWQPHYNYNVAAEWSVYTWPPQKSALLLSLLTNQIFFGKGGQAPTKRWRIHYDYNVSESFWYGSQAPRNLNLLQTSLPFFSEVHRFNYNDYGAWGFWTWLYSGISQVLQIQANPFPSKAWHYDYNDAAVWQGQPRKSALLSPLLTANVPFPSEAWHYDYNDQSLWQGQPDGSALLGIILTSGGQSFFKQWHYDNDDSSGWTWQYPRPGALLQPPTPFFSKAWHYDLNDQSSWQGQPRKSALLSPLLTANQPFFSDAWHYDYNDQSLWTGQPLKSTILSPILTSSIPPPSKAWHYDYDVGVFWQPFQVINPNLVTIPLVTKPHFWLYDYNDASLWSWRSPRSTLIEPILTSAKPFSKGWHYDYNDAAFWIWKPRASSLNIPLTIGVVPKPSRAWHYDYDVGESRWAWAPLRIRTIYLPAFSATATYQIIIIP